MPHLHLHIRHSMNYTALLSSWAMSQDLPCNYRAPSQARYRKQDDGNTYDGPSELTKILKQ
eukprot:351335-Chlamydomonas_euryale.AAC.15